MSFYRSALAAIAAMALIAPVFADDTTTTTTGSDSSMTQTTASTDTKVDVNKATAKELMKVKGINSSKAKAIVAYRKKNGDIKTLDDLSKINGFKGMNEKTLRNIQDHLSVE